MMESQLDRMEAAQARVEAKLDALLDALAEDADEKDGGGGDLRTDLDGNPLEVQERDQSASLD